MILSPGPAFGLPLESISLLPVRALACSWLMLQLSTATSSHWCPFWSPAQPPQELSRARPLWLEAWREASCSLPCLASRVSRQLIPARPPSRVHRLPSPRPAQHHCTQILGSTLGAPSAPLPWPTNSTGFSPELETLPPGLSETTCLHPCAVVQSVLPGIESQGMCSRVCVSLLPRITALCCSNSRKQLSHLLAHFYSCLMGKALQRGQVWKPIPDFH